MYDCAAPAQQTHLLERFQLDANNMAVCLKAIEAGYHASNPYHNRWVLP